MGPLPALLVSFLQQAVASTGACVGPLSAYSPEDLVGNFLSSACPFLFIRSPSRNSEDVIMRDKKLFATLLHPPLVIVSCGKRMEEFEFCRMFDQKFNLTSTISQIVICNTLLLADSFFAGSCFLVARCQRLGAW